jgi:Do/DeqQ family serine protease
LTREAVRNHLIGKISKAAMTLRSILILCGLACLIGGPTHAQTVPISREQVQLTFAPVVKRAGPAVVNIYASHVVKQQQFASPLMADPFFRQFFGRALQNQPPRMQNTLGSGVLVSPEGMIVTNFHVVKDSQEIKVVLADRREFDAKIVRSDERADLAVIQIESGQKLPYLELRDSDDLEVGDMVLAIGNPFGVGQTVTSGIVSALARTNTGANDYRYFIQTDAAINPGNSGGALVTLDGKLVGINTMIFSQSGGSVGIGFAIPANMVRTVIQVGGSGKIVRPWIGAGGQPVTPDLASSLKLDRPGGVLLNEVYPGGPADRAGLRVGDVITAVNDREVEDPEAMRFRVATQPLGSTARLTVTQKGAVHVIPISLVAPPEDPPRDRTVLTGNQPFSGATVENLSPAVADELGMPSQSRGVIITELKDGTPPVNLGIRPGDIILRIGKLDVTSVKQLVELVAQPARAWHIELKRDGKPYAMDVTG